MLPLLLASVFETSTEYATRFPWPHTYLGSYRRKWRVLFRVTYTPGEDNAI